MSVSMKLKLHVLKRLEKDENMNKIVLELNWMVHSAWLEEQNIRDRILVFEKEFYKIN